MNCQPISTVYRNRRFKHTVADLLSSATNKKIIYDIIISGGGMIGASLACVLSRNPLLKDQKILLIEGAKKKDWVLGENYSNRVSALNPSTKRLLESVGIWKHIADARFKPVKQMKIWGSGSEAVVEFDKTESENVTYIVENDVLLAAVDKELEQSRDTVSVTYGTKVQHYDLPLNSSGLVSLLMDDGISHSCSLLLGTDGANSKVRERMEVEYIKWNYGQSAIVATLELEQMPSNDIAWQRFLSTGPVALLPLTDNLSSLVWSTTTDNAKQLLKLSGEDFVKALNNVLTEPSQRNSLVDFTSNIASLVSQNLKIPLAANTPVPIPPTVTAVQDGSRAAFPLGFGHSSSYVRPGVAILGDAAHRVHPLAGQGVNLGFGDIECLNRVLGEAVLNGKVINSFSTLKQYEKERLRRNLPTMIAIDAINKIYSNSNTVVTAVGHFAMQIANSFTPIKTLMVKQASS